MTFWQRFWAITFTNLAVAFVFVIAYMQGWDDAVEAVGESEKNLLKENDRLVREHNVLADRLNALRAVSLGGGAPLQEGTGDVLDVEFTVLRGGKE